MIKNIIPVAFLGLSVVGLVACNNNKYKKTKDGLEYKIIKDEKGDKKPVIGDIVQMHLHIHYGDSTWLDSRKVNNNMPLEFPLMPAAFKGDLSEGLMMLTAGDSASFLVSVDSVMKMSQGELPKYVKPGGKITYDVVLVSVKSKSDAEKDMQQQALKQKDIDDKILQDYFTKNNLQPQKTPSGLYYIIEKEGTGATIQPGQVAGVMYTGKTLDGKSFDSNIDPQFGHTDELKFPVGQGQVIPGWDEGILLMKKGSKAKLFIPSPLAYRDQSPGPGIPANSILMFEVEMKNIEDQKRPNQ